VLDSTSIIYTITIQCKLFKDALIARA